jgi:WD40 repeat protein
VALYDAHTLKQIRRLGNGSPASYCSDFVAFSPNGKILAYGDAYNVNMWDTVAGQDLGEPEMDLSSPDSVGQVESVAFSPDSRILAIGDRSKQLVLWNISTRKVLARLGAQGEGWVSAVAFSPDGKVIYGGSTDQTVRLWDFSSYKGNGRVAAEKIKLMATIKGHTGTISSIACSPNGSWVATVSTDGSVKLWAATGPREFDTIEGVQAASPGGNFVAKVIDAQSSGSGSEQTLVFDLRGDKPERLATLNGINPMLSADGKTLATALIDVTGGTNVTVKLQDLSTGQRLATLRSRFGERFSDDGRLFTAPSPDGKTLILWDTSERKTLGSIGNDAPLNHYAVSPDATVIVTVDQNGQRLTSWEVASQRPLSRVTMKAGPQSTEADAEDLEAPLALTSDGKLLAITNANVVELWDTRSTRDPIVLGKHEEDVRVVAFSRDGKLLATGDSGGMVAIWNTSARTALSRFKGHRDEVTALAFAPDGRTLASGDGGTVKLYGTTSLRELITLTHELSPTSEIHVLQGSEDTIAKIYFSDDGRSLITRSGNEVLRIWRGANEARTSAEGL